MRGPRRRSGLNQTRPQSWQRQCRWRVRYALADVVSGVREAVQTLRSGDYEVWDGAKAVSVQELVAV